MIHPRNITLFTLSDVDEVLGEIGLSLTLVDIYFSLKTNLLALFTFQMSNRIYTWFLINSFLISSCMFKLLLFPLTNYISRITV
jgi:hypothetical protein